MRRFERYCDEFENIENYEKAKADDFKGWHCHHRLETHNSDGRRRTVDISIAELKALGMYYHRPSSELVFMTMAEHCSLHMRGKTWNKGKRLSEKTKKKLSEANSGEKNPFYGKKHSDETRKKIAESAKGRHYTEETRKKMAESRKGKSPGNKGKYWFNNGKINLMAKECPDGFVPGMLSKRR